MSTASATPAGRLGCELSLAVAALDEAALDYLEARTRLLVAAGDPPGLAAYRAAGGLEVRISRVLARRHDEAVRRASR